MDTNNEESSLPVDKNGLEYDDEFYGIHFIQVSNYGEREVKPITYALMCWWEVLLGNQDIIDVSQDSNKSMLHFESIFDGTNSFDSNLNENEAIDIDHVIEVDENEMSVSMFCYIPKPIPIELLEEVEFSILDINPELKFGSVEISTIVDEGADVNDDKIEYYLRFRATIYLKGIKVGKVIAIENMVEHAEANLGEFLESLCYSEILKKWIMN